MCCASSIMTAAWASSGMSEARKSSSAWTRSWRVVSCTTVRSVDMTPKSCSICFRRSSRSSSGLLMTETKVSPIEPLQHGAAEERLAAADLAGDDHQWFPAADRIRQFLKRVGMRCAFEQIPRIGRQAERRVTQSEKLLVTHLRNGTPTKRRDGVSSKIFYWSDSQRRWSEVTGPLNLLRSHRPMPATE